MDRILSQRGAVIFRDLGVDPELAQHKSVTDMKNKAVLAVPLALGETVLGILFLDSPVKGCPFHTGQLRLLEAFGAMASIAIDHARLHDLALYDRRTGLRRDWYIDVRLPEEFERANRYNHDLSLVFVDIDHFKEFNSKYGFENGHRVLRSVAECIRGQVRGTDNTMRYGGEEFVALLPNALAFPPSLRQQ